MNKAIHVEQDYKLIEVAALTGVQKNVPVRATLRAIKISPAFGGKPAMVFFCDTWIHYEHQVFHHEPDPDYGIGIKLVGLERLVKAAGRDSSRQLPCVWIQAVGVEMLWKADELICDFTDAMFTKKGEEPEKLEMPAPLPEPRAERQNEPEEAELVPVRMCVSR